MYFDAVVNAEGTLVFTGTPDEIRKFLQSDPPTPEGWTVRVLAQTIKYLRPEEYLSIGLEP